MTEDLTAANIAAGLPLFASRSLAEIEAHLAAVEKSDCRCSDSQHENAIHDLVHIDMPVLLAEVKRLRGRVSEPRRIESGEEANELPVGSVLLDAKARAWQKVQSKVSDSDYWSVAGSGTVEYSGAALIARHGEMTVVHVPVPCKRQLPAADLDRLSRAIVRDHLETPVDLTAHLPRRYRDRLSDDQLSDLSRRVRDLLVEVIGQTAGWLRGDFEETANVR